MKNKIVLRIILITLLCGFLPTISNGQIVTIELTGKVYIVDDPFNDFGGQIHINDTVTGFYTYDTSTPDSEPSDPTIGVYWYYSAPCGVSITINSFHFKTDPDNVRFLVGIGDNYSGDIYSISSKNNLPLSSETMVESISWQLENDNGTAISSDVLPTTAPNLNDWNKDYGLSIVGPDIGCNNYLIRADITSVRLIPEPTSLLLLLFGAGVCRIRKS